MEKGIFTKAEYDKALAHYECVAAELDALANYASNPGDKDTLRSAADILRGLVAAGGACAVVGLT